ncbi:MAG: AraC family transcriptional regulator [Bacteroidales bacterium]|nr:AraC family transcriptional regulator [Bacteroidales bacterium]
MIDNLSKENFDVEELATEVNMSRSSVHRRLKRLTNQNASHFIREIRLRKALEMLQDDRSTAAEVGILSGIWQSGILHTMFPVQYYGYPPGEASKAHQGKSK